MFYIQWLGFAERICGVSKIYDMNDSIDYITSQNTITAWRTAGFKCELCPVVHTQFAFA
jgi:hypothetical protein